MSRGSITAHLPSRDVTFASDRSRFAAPAAPRRIRIFDPCIYSHSPLRGNESLSFPFLLFFSLTLSSSRCGYLKNVRTHVSASRTARDRIIQIILHCSYVSLCETQSPTYHDVAPTHARHRPFPHNPLVRYNGSPIDVLFVRCLLFVTPAVALCNIRLSEYVSSLFFPLYLLPLLPIGLLPP